MYQETPAQKNRPKKQPKETVVETKAVLPEIDYSVSMSRPFTHLLEVEMHVKWPAMPDVTELKMPVWTPGSYLVREYERHVQDIAVKDATGTPLTWSKANKNTWAVNTKGSKEFTASYRVYANELTVRTNELNDEHAFWNNGALLLFIKDQLAAPSTVKVNPAKNWRVATGLPQVAGQTNTFRAPNYDILYDSPFEVSDYKEIIFDSHGKMHRFVITGQGNYDLKRLAEDTAKIVDEAYKIFGEYDYDNYTFIVNLRGGGGLEHLNSTALQANRFAFSPASKYKGFLGLVAHEYFHNYNVKRIRPEALGPFNYETENYTRSLWMAEGGTEYYANLLLLRAGFLTYGEFLEHMSTAMGTIQGKPGRFETSLEDASFDAWVKFYRPDENAVNNQISYYDKGEIVSWLLDLRIRADSGGTKSLDDVMRYLWAEYFKKGRGYTPSDLQKAAELMAGKSLDDFFAKYVRGVVEIDYAEALAPFGLRVDSREAASTRAYSGTDSADGSITVRGVPALGVDLSEDNGKLTVRTVLADGPAYNFGLNTGDQLLAIDGNKANQAFVPRYLAMKKAGDRVKLTVFRFDQLREFEVVVGNNTRPDLNILAAAAPTDQQRKLFHDFFNADL